MPDSAPSQAPENENIAPPIPSERYDLRVLCSIRRIIRSADLYSRKLAIQFGVTVPQLLCLTQIVETDGITLKQLSEEVFLSPSTVVGILDRLETRNLITRERSPVDRRLVLARPTAEGRALVDRSPSPLQADLMQALSSLPDLERATIALSLERIVDLMELGKVDAAPILDVGVGSRFDSTSED